MSNLPEQKWKHLGVVVAVGITLAAGREFHVRATVPLREQEAESLQNVANLQEQIRVAQKTIAEVQGEEKAAAPMRRAWARLEEGRPSSSPIVWVPTAVRDHFARAWSAVQLIRLNTVQDVPDLAGYARGFWSAALPVDATGANVSALLGAVADLEQQQPDLRILDFAIRPDPEKEGGRLALLNLTTLFRK